MDGEDDEMGSRYSRFAGERSHPTGVGAIKRVGQSIQPVEGKTTSKRSSTETRSATVQRSQRYVSEKQGQSQDGHQQSSAHRSSSSRENYHQRSSTRSSFRSHSSRNSQHQYSSDRHSNRSRSPRQSIRSHLSRGSHQQSSSDRHYQRSRSPFSSRRRSPSRHQGRSSQYGHQQRGSSRGHTAVSGRSGLNVEVVRPECQIQTRTRQSPACLTGGSLCSAKSSQSSTPSSSAVPHTVSSEKLNENVEIKVIPEAQQRKKYKKNKCPLCEIEVLVLKRHVEMKHLPWYFAPENACWTCKKPSNNNSDLRSSHGQCQNSNFDDRQLPVWLETMSQFLDFLVTTLRSQTPEQLLSYCVQQKLFLDVHGSCMSPTRLTLLQLLRQFRGTAPLEMSIRPPNCAEALLSWNTVLGLLGKLDDAQSRNAIKQFPLANPGAPVPTILASDGHCHLDLLQKRCGQSLSSIVAREKRLAPFTITWVVSNSVFPDSWKWVPENVSDVNIALSYGVHPRLTDCHINWDFIEKLCALDKCLAVGECGLDITAGNMVKQKDLFNKQISIARKLGKLLILHLRDTSNSSKIYQEAFQLVANVLPKSHAVYIHCFTADYPMYMVWAKYFRNLLIGITWGSTKVVGFDKIARSVPMENLALESDAPFLSPVGGINTPWLIWHQAKVIAQHRNLPWQVVLASASYNVHRFFAL